MSEHLFYTETLDDTLFFKYASYVRTQQICCK